MISLISKIADAAGIGNSRYNLPSEVVVHPQLTARDRWRTVGTSKGDIQASRPPPVIKGFEQPMGVVPGLGEHTDAVLSQLGVSTDELAGCGPMVRLVRRTRERGTGAVVG